MAATRQHRRKQARSSGRKLSARAAGKQRKSKCLAKEPVLVTSLDLPLRSNTQKEEADVEQPLAIAGAPPWFQAWHNEQFQPFATRLQRDITTLRGDVAALQRDMTTVQIQIGALSRCHRATKRCRHTTKYSATRRQGDVTTINQDRSSEFLVNEKGSWNEVPFPDGRMPWGLLVHVPNRGNINLPRLDNLTALQGLTLTQSYGYCAGYFPNDPVICGPKTLERRKKKIATAIGVVLE